MAEVSPQQLLLGEVFRGARIEGALKIKNTGKGALLCNIMVEKPWLKPQKFEVSEGTETYVSIPVDINQLPPGEYKADIVLQTNSYIYNTDKYNIPMEFHLVSMDVEPREIDLGILWFGEPKGQQLRARRSDGARISISAPQNLPPWLEISPAGRQTMSVKINWMQLHLNSDQDLEAVVDITDELSPLREEVRIRGRVLIPHIAVDGLNFDGGRWKKKTLPMVIRNMGNGKLVIKRMEISPEQDWIRLDVKKKKGAPPEFLVTVDRRLIPKSDRYNHHSGSIMIYSNDPVEPILDVPVEVSSGANGL